MNAMRVFLMVLCLVVACVGAAAAAPTTTVTITKLASDGVTVIDETTVDYVWLEANLPVMGDGTTHYYHQGPVFLDDPDPATEEMLRWNPAEDTNVLTKDMGAVKGTNVKDLCDLVGGMNAGEEVLVKASDGLSKTFAYENVYGYSSREGPMVLTWYIDGLSTYPSGSYPDTGYSDGMRLVWFADDATNPFGVHAFGNWNWHEAAAPEYWYYYYSGTEMYPTTTGLSVKYISDIIILSDDPAPVTDVLYDGPVTLTSGATFDVTAYSLDAAGTAYTVSETTPLGALEATGLSYDVTDKRYAYDGVLLLDNVETYLRKSPGYWYAYVNDVYKDGYMNTPNGLNVIELADGDTVEYYYAADVADPADLAAVRAAATAAVKTVADIQTGTVMDVLYEGTVALTSGTTFDVVAYNSGTTYTVSETTPLCALDATGLSYDVTDKNYATSGALLLDNVDSYIRKAPGYWYAYVNDEYKDGYNNPAGGLNLIELADGDKVEYYYAADVTDPADLTAVQAVATAAVLTVADLPAPYDVLFEGTVDLTPGETFDKVAYNSGTTYTVSETTPLGALDATGLSYDVTDKNYATSGALLLDNVDSYIRKAPGYWYAYVNDEYKDGYNNPAGGLNLIELADGDKVEYYYAADVTDETDLAEVQGKATAAVLTVASTGTTPSDWTLELSGAIDTTVSRDYFEEGLACVHYAEWTDIDGNVWGGVPLWLLVAMVDDNPDTGPYHINFNDDIAAQGYTVKVIAGDGWDTSLASADIARDEGYIVANTLNGEPLPLLTEPETGKPCWPLHLKGPGVSGGQQVGNIVRIELVGLPEPSEGWTLEMIGEVGDTITQSEFEEGLACTTSGHLVSWTDDYGDTWSGVPLWVLLGAVDDIELASHWTFSDDVAAAGYTVNVIAGDGFSRTFLSADVARNDGYIVANMKNGVELTVDDGYPLKLNGPAITSGMDRVGSIATIEILELQTPPAEPGSWNLNMAGKITDVISRAEFEEGLACPASGHYAEWTDIDGNVWSGMPLWFLCGWVDDRQPHEYSATQAMAGYKITVKAGDGYAKEFASADVAWSSDYIVANMANGEPLDESWPLRLVGDGVTRDDGTLSGMSVGNIVEIELNEFNEPTAIPKVHIVKYGEDQQTIVAETWIDYTEMMMQFDVIGDGETQYHYQGITMDPEDIWGVADETKGGYKISNAVKGTRVIDLVSLVGGMGEGTDIVFLADDGYKTILPYTSIYTTAEIQERQGDAVLAWYADGVFVPGYGDGMRLFFMPEDTIYGQWDMHESMPAGYWHYYYQSYSASDPDYGQYAPGILYPSCAGTSAKYVTEIRVYTTPASDWNLHLDGIEIGGMEYTVNKAYFEAALACQFGANHLASYTDDKGREWSGMPLYFLCGFVDDADQHSDEAYNEALALAGYDIVITATDGFTVTIPSEETVRSTEFIIANTLDGYRIPDDDSSWPLRFVGAGVAMDVKGVASIELMARAPASAVVLYDGEVTLCEGETFDWTDADGFDHTVDWPTPHGALHAASVDGGFMYGGIWKETKNTALIDWIDSYVYDGTNGWNYRLNGVYQNYFSDTTGVSNLLIQDGDELLFYFGPKDDQTVTQAEALVRIRVHVTPSGSGTPVPEFPSVAVPLAITGALYLVARGARRD